MRLISAIIFMFVGVYSLYVTRKHWNYVSQLRDSVGNRKIKRQEKTFLVVGVLSILYAAWNIWIFARGNWPYSEPIQTAKNPSLVGNVTGGIGLLLFYAWLFWRTLKDSRGNRVIQCGTITVMLFFVLLALSRIPNLPFDYVWWLWPTLFLLCMLTLFFLLQQGHRALRNRWGRKQLPKS